MCDTVGEALTALGKCSCKRNPIKQH